MKPGYKSTEFWLKIIASALIAGGGAFNLSEAGLPPAANGALAVILPLLLAWLSAKYGDNRTALKAAAAEAGEKAAAEVTSLGKAADVLTAAATRKPQ